MAKQVILVLIDGLRADGIPQACAPHLRRLMARGCSTLGAQTVMPSITLPAHFSLFHSLAPEQHGVMNNDFAGRGDLVPGLVEMVHAAELDTAAFFSWEELRDLWRPGRMTHTNFVNIYSKPARDFDLEVAKAAANYLTHTPTAFSFVYLGMLDETAHQVGWNTPAYIDAIDAADAALGHLLGSLEAAGQINDTTILVQSDHGGHDFGHGDAIPEDMTIPWMVAGPGIRQGVTLQTPVSILDSAPTMARMLGLSIPDGWQGKVIEEVFETM